jgi:hypothetical protein
LAILGWRLGELLERPRDRRRGPGVIEADQQLDQRHSRSYIEVRVALDVDRGERLHQGVDHAPYLGRSAILEASQRIHVVLLELAEGVEALLPRFQLLVQAFEIGSLFVPSRIPG